MAPARRPALPVRSQIRRAYSALFDWLARVSRASAVGRRNRRAARDAARPAARTWSIPTGCRRLACVYRRAAQSSALTVADLEKGLLLTDPASPSSPSRNSTASAPRSAAAACASERDIGGGHPQSGRTADRRSGGARRSWRRPLPRPANAGHRRRPDRISDTRIRRAATSSTSRYCPAAGQPLHRHRPGTGAAAQTRRRGLGKGQTPRAREKAHDAAVELLEIQALRAARQGHAFPTPDEHYQCVRRCLSVRGNPRPGSAPSTRCCTTWNPPSPWTGWCAATWVSARPKWRCAPTFLAVMGKAQVAVLVPDHAARPAAFPELPGPVRRSAVAHRGVVTLSQPGRDQRKVLTALADGRSTSSSAPIGCCRTTCASSVSGW